MKVKLLASIGLGILYPFLTPPSTKAQEPPKISIPQDNQSLDSKLDAKLKELMSLSFINESDHAGLRRLLRIGGSDVPGFIKWYERKVNEVTEGENPEKKDKVLEVIGRNFIAGPYRGINSNLSLKIAEHLINFIPAYIKLIEKNISSPEFLSNALKTCDERIHITYLEITYVGTKESLWFSTQLAEKTFDLYELTLKGISNLPNINSDLKKQVFKPLQHFGIYSDNKKIQDRIVKILSDKYFGLQKNHLDTEGLEFFIDSIENSEPNVRRAEPGFSPHIVFGLIKQNKDYFESTVKQCAEDLKKSNGSSGDALEKAIRFFNFFSMVNKYRIPTRDDCPSLKPIEETFLFLFRNAKVTAQTNNEGERIVEDKEWQILKYLYNIFLTANPGFRNELVNVIKERLRNEKNPYTREKCYQALGILLNYKGEDSDFEALQASIFKEQLPQAIRGTAYACAYGYEHHCEDEWIGNVGKGIHIIKPNKINWDKGLAYVMSLAKGDLKIPQQRLVINAIRVLDDDEFIKSLLPDHKFPPPEIITINGKKEIYYSRENIEAGKALMRLKHNAFLFLAYTASQCKHRNNDTEQNHVGDDVSDPSPNIKYKKFIVNLLENKFLSSIFEMDGLDYPELWGEKIAALITLYERTYDALEGRETVIPERLKNLSDSIFDLCERTLLREAVRKNGQSDFELSGPTLLCNIPDLGSKYPEWKEVKKQVNIIRLRIAEGVLRSAPHEGLIRYRNYLANNMPRGHYDGIELRDPYEYLRELHGWEPSRN